MAGEGQGYQGIVLPSIFGNPGDALKSGIALKERQNERQDSLAQRQSEIDYRNRKDAQLQADKDEMEQYRKVQMIKEYTDLNKHQTGDAIVDAIANQKANDLVKKWTGVLQQNKNLSYADILNGTSADMGQLIPALNSTRDELKQSDAAAQLLKQQFPEANIPQIMQDHRTDILHRRVDANGNFINPTLVAPSQFANQLSNPDFLSRYVNGNKNLTEAIVNPKGTDPSSVYVGKPNDAHTKFEANVPFWKKPNFDPTQLQAGFLPKGKPELVLKSSVIPAESIPSSNGKPFTVIDKDVYDRFSQDPKSNLELISATRQRYPSYDNFNQTEKEYAKRNVLYDQIKTLDQSQFHPTATTNTPRTTVNVNGGADASKNAIRDLYARTKKRVDQTPIGKGVPLNELSAAEQQEYVKMANEIVKPPEGEALGQKDIALLKDPDGTINIVKVNRENNGAFKSLGATITPLDFTSVNVPAQTGVKTKNAVIAKGNEQPATPTKVKMIQVQTGPNGETGEIREDQIDAFLKKHPKGRKL